MKKFFVATDVAAAPALGWQVLTDFAQYSAWNPLLRRIAGEAKVGASLRLRVARSLGSDDTMALPAKVRVCVPETEIAWGGGVPGLLDVHHHFRLEKRAEGFRFHHGEDFSGVLLSLLWPILGKRVRQANYEAFNVAFKARCEALGTGVPR